MKRGNPEPHQAFSDPTATADYGSTTLQKVPGFADLHRMTMLLLSEHISRSAEILVVGAGGGLELEVLAEAQPEWSFVGVDPSTAMLDAARLRIAQFKDRVELRHGYIDDAPPGPFDGATCLLMLHFLDRQERLRTLKEIRRRLRPNAALVVAHHSYPEGDDVERWLARSAGFANRAGIDAAKAKASARSMAENLPLLSTAEEEALLHQAGFANVALFYAAFSFRGWVATAGEG